MWKRPIVVRKNRTIEVVASVNQWGTVAKTLGGGNVNVTSIINSTNVDAHDYEPTTSDIAKLQKAQVIIVNGAGYDAWAVKAAQSANATIVNAAAVGGVNDGENPHVWFSADVRKAVAQAITEAYEQADAAKRVISTSCTISGNLKKTTSKAKSPK